ncbi:MAG TPA: hypothetical protein VF592_03545 [Sphingomonas sp.]|jgi:hypothetical protein|uniref:hypothetical protein n=1 Tax=Sphingomonas sp. TaxID=28214 RepID=UPI002EDA3990
MTSPFPPERLAPALAAITAAADAGRRCPTNRELADLIGGETGALGQQAVHALERAGLIKVDRFAQARRVTILATGQATFVKAGQWPNVRVGLRYTKPRPDKVCTRDTRADPVLNEKLTEAQIEARRVDSSTCRRCGARVAVGCEHAAANPHNSGASA